MLEIIHTLGTMSERKCFDFKKNDFSVDLMFHSENVAKIALGIARCLKINTEEMLVLYGEALYHDIGKSKIPEAILYESKQKLYELEQICDQRKFFRASKSTIINIARISHIKPSLSGRFEAFMENGEKVLVSRQYVPMLKSKLGI